MVSLFAWRGFQTAVGESQRALTSRALQTNSFAAHVRGPGGQGRAGTTLRGGRAGGRVGRARQAVAEAVRQPELARLLADLSDPRKSEAELEPLRRRFRDHPARKRLGQKLDALMPARMRPAAKGEREEVASWFFCDAHGISTLRTPESDTVGKNFAWRSFFWGGPTDQPRSWRPGPGQHVEATEPSVVFSSQASGQWIVAISTPVFDDSPGREFLGVVALTVEVGRFVELLGGETRLAVLVDWRPGPHQGTILQHPSTMRSAARRPHSRAVLRLPAYGRRSALA